MSPVGRLQLRHLGFGYGNRLFGIDALAEHAVQRRPVVLFHIADDPDLEFSFIDAGDIHFLGAPEDIKACRWDRLTVWPDSG